MSREFIAQKLKELRLKSGLTADEVGLRIGKSGKTVNAWEHNRGQPDAEVLIALCDIYEVDDILYEFREIKNSLQISDTKKEELIANYNQLNDQGKNKLLEYSNDLINSGSYFDQPKEKRA